MSAQKKWVFFEQWWRYLASFHLVVLPFQLLAFKTTLLSALHQGMEDGDHVWDLWPGLKVVYTTSILSTPDCKVTVSFAGRKTCLGERICQIQGKLSSKYSSVLTDVWYSTLKHLSIGSYLCWHINYRSRSLGHWWIFSLYYKLLLFNLWA